MPALEIARHEEFCNQYLICRFNGTEAVRETKYSNTGASVTANRLLSYPKIAERIAELIEKRCKRLDYDADWVLKESVKCYEACVADGDYSVAERFLKQVGMNVGSQAFTANIKLKREKDLEDLSDEEIDSRLGLMDQSQDKDDDSVVVTYSS